MAACHEAITDAKLSFDNNDELKLRTVLYLILNYSYIYICQGCNIGVMNSNITKITDYLTEANKKGF